MGMPVRHDGVWKDPKYVLVRDSDLWKIAGSDKITLPDMGGAFGGGFFTGVIGFDAYVIADKASETKANWSTSSSHCKNYTGGGYSDWFFPSVTEFLLFMDNLWPSDAGTPAAFKTSGAQAMITVLDQYYWTSDVSGSNGIGLRVQDKYQHATTKTSLRNVRPMRKVAL